MTGDTSTALTKELRFFKEHQEELLEQYRGKVLVLRGQKVVGAYDTVLAAYLDAKAKHPPGSFMVQRCEPGPGAYTVAIATPGIIA